ncbi:putative ester cyclase [Arthrobacter ulcerisalmonis]|nr:ester cyclase [Arthrobacter ulcerisalmonis]MDQ0664536.1 putative ester cyclase [Arthrobacter ulcerisalmonis]
MGTDELRKAYRRLIAAVVANDEKDLAGIVHKDITDHGAMPGQPPGLPGIVSWMHGMHASLSGLTGTVEDTIVEGDKVAGRMVWQGTHTGSFLGLQATNKPVKLASLHIIRFERGLAVEWWGVPDLYGALTEIGARLNFQDN